MVETAGLGAETIILLVSSLLKLLSFLQKHNECSGLLKGSQMNNLIGCGVLEGGVFNMIGSTEKEQDE